MKSRSLHEIIQQNRSSAPAQGVITPKSLPDASAPTGGAQGIGASVVQSIARSMVNPTAALQNLGLPTGSKEGTATAGKGSIPAGMGSGGTGIASSKTVDPKIIGRHR